MAKDKSLTIEPQRLTITDAQHTDLERPTTNAERVRRYKRAKAARAASDPSYTPAMIQMNVWVRPASRQKLRAIARQRGISVGKLIDALADSLYKELASAEIEAEDGK
ncbi:hypothetical protein [Amantichitinum ursilacus]|uniref:Uncharacterized protein n=1 Tax=Amantichitinum ursilacus TaxID=857265 RepID=A0A0N0GNB9_9NEIS|nr:hypothetical protein [Amantichitinum ursilacus]KPC52300.1 hypothetical protein WG78_14615 [Amantichitinum ursilacus]